MQLPEFISNAIINSNKAHKKLFISKISQVKKIFCFTFIVALILLTYYKLKMQEGSVNSGNIKESDVEIYETTLGGTPKPHLMLGDTVYEASGMPIKDLPAGYIFEGELTEEMSYDGESFVGCKYYTNAGADELYVYTLTGTPHRADNYIDLNKLGMFYLCFKKVDN